MADNFNCVPYVGTASGGASTGSQDVNIAGQDAPLLVTLTNPPADIEIVCASTDGRPLAYNAGDNTLTELGGGAIGDGASAVACPDVVDRESITKCMENADGQWQVISYVNTADPNDVIGPIYCNPQGAVVADPGDLVACVDAPLVIDTTTPLDIDFEPLTDFMETIVRVDYEPTGFCALDANGDKIPLVAQFTQREYAFDGTLFAETIVLSRMANDGSGWTPYVLQAGEVIGECGVETITSNAVLEAVGMQLVPSGSSFTLPANVSSFTVTAQTGSFDVSTDNGATVAFTGRVGSRTWGQGTIEAIANSDQIRIISQGDVDVIWETV